jgi:hypothetical protein
MGYVKALTVTNMQIIITKIECRIGQSCKIRYDVLICAGVGKPSRNRSISNSKVSRGLLGTTAKLGTIGSCVTETGAQLTADMLLSRPLPSPELRLVCCLILSFKIVFLTKKKNFVIFFDFISIGLSIGLNLKLKFLFNKVRSES